MTTLYASIKLLIENLYTNCSLRVEQFTTVTDVCSVCKRATTLLFFPNITADPSEPKANNLASWSGQFITVHIAPFTAQTTSFATAHCTWWLYLKSIHTMHSWQIWVSFHYQYCFILLYFCYSCSKVMTLMRTSIYTPFIYSNLSLHWVHSFNCNLLLAFHVH